MDRLDHPGLEQEVDALLNGLQPSAPTQQEPVSFDVNAAPANPLQARLLALAQEVSAAPATETVHFGIEEESSLRREENELQTFLETMKDEMQFLAHVRTPAAETFMTWDGDTRTTLSAAWQPSQAQIHLAALDKHLRRKLLALRLTLMLAAALLRVTLLTGLTGPAAWLTAYRFLKDASTAWREAAQTFL